MPAQPKPKKPGRPKLANGDAKAIMLRVRITPEEASQIEFAAKISDQTTSEWIRSAVGEAYRRALSIANREGSHLSKPRKIRRDARAVGLKEGIRG
jgi:hypothetical protein